MSDETEPVRIHDPATGRILHAPTVVHYRGRRGVLRWLLGRSEGWDVMCACGMAASGMPSETEARDIYQRHARRALNAITGLS